MKYMGYEVLQALKTRNAINKANPGRVLQFKLRNISVNGEKRGCYGHVTDLDTEVCVYINTERSVSAPHDMLYRLANDEQDFTSLGMVNNWANTLEELVEGVTRLLGAKKEKEEVVAKKQVKEESLANKEKDMKVKFEKANVWVSTNGEVEEVPGYKFKVELEPDNEVYVGLVKRQGGWVLIDTYTGTSMAGRVFSTRDKAVDNFFGAIINAYRKVFMNEMHEAKASDFSKKVLHANGFETKGEQVKKAEEKLAEKAKQTEKKVVPEPEVAEAVATDHLSFIDGDAESAEKVMTELRKLMEGGNVVVRWKGKPMAPIRVEGDTKPYQKVLKEHGLRWARKGFWYLKPTAC